MFKIKGKLFLVSYSLIDTDTGARRRPLMCAAKQVSFMHKPTLYYVTFVIVQTMFVMASKTTLDTYI